MIEIEFTSYCFYVDNIIIAVTNTYLLLHTNPDASITILLYRSRKLRFREVKLFA